MGRQYHKTFAELGAENVFKYGEGNSDGNKTEDEFNVWKQDLWRELAEYYRSR